MDTAKKQLEVKFHDITKKWTINDEIEYYRLTVNGENEEYFANFQEIFGHYLALPDLTARQLEYLDKIFTSLRMNLGK